MSTPIYLNTNPKVLRDGGRKASRSTSLDEMLNKAWKAYLRENADYIEDAGEWDSQNPPEETYEFITEYLMEKLAPDLSKVVFSAENCDWTGEEFGPEEIMGYHKLDNGLEYFGVAAGGDWEMFLFFIIYTDGKKLRAYIPTYGNSFNAEAGTAIGSEFDSEKGVRALAKYKKMYPKLAAELEAEEYPDEKTFVSRCFVSQFADGMDNWEQRLDIDAEKVIEDIKHRIEVI